MSVVYTEPQLCTYQGDMSQSWFVYFTIRDTETGESKPVQARGGINYFHDTVSRTKEGEALLKSWKDRLKEGWTPFAGAADKAKKMKFIEALTFGLKMKSLASKSQLDYASAIRYCSDGASELKITNMPISAIKRTHIKLLFAKLKEDKQWSNHAYNKYLDYIGGILTELVEAELIEYNPSHKIGRLPVAESDKYQAFEESEKKIIHDFFTKKFPAFMSI